MLLRPFLFEAMSKGPAPPRTCLRTRAWSSITSALHAKGEPAPLARELYASLQKLLALPDEVIVYPSHFGSSVCGRALSSNPFSSIRFERRHNAMLQHADANSFARALLVDLPPSPADQAEVVAENRRGRTHQPA